MPQVRPIEPIALPDNIVKAEIGSRPKIVSMRPKDLSVDGAYQRDLSKKSLKLIYDLVRDWDWRRYKVPVVAKVGHEWHVIDGQHTAIAAVTHGGIEEIDVMVVDADRSSDRARAFIGHNKDRVPITNTQLFFAAAASGGIVTTLEKFGPVIAAKSTELALAKKIRRSRALAIVIYQHTRKRRPSRTDDSRTGNDARSNIVVPREPSRLGT
jgi:hypothetical protein